MDHRLLDQLAVPQPPYRMPRPLAMLAAEPPPELEIPSSELEPLPPEAPIESEKPLSLAEAIEQQEAAIAAQEQEERQKLEAATPPPGATAQESTEDSRRREEAMMQVAVAATEGVAEVRALAPEGKSVGAMSAEEREANQALAARLRAERDQRRADQAAEEERLRKEREEQEERARKEDIEFKKSVTRSQTAALKEDALREEKKLEQGVEFEQPAESAAQRAARLGREALQALNDFKNAQERGAKPEEVEFARQRADIAQDRAEAAKRGEIAPEQGIDMAKVEAAQPAPAESPQDEKDQERATGEGMPEVPNITINRETSSGRIYGRVEQPAASVEAPPAKKKVRPTADELEEYQRQLRKNAGEKELAVSESPVASEVGQSVEPTPAETTPTPEQKRIIELEEENARLKAERVQQKGEEKKRERKEDESGRSPSGEFSEIAEKILTQKSKPGWFSQEWLKIQADAHHLGRYWNSIWAKRAKDLETARNKRLAELEKEAEEYAGKSWRHTAAAAFLYAPRINWYKAGVARISSALERREDRRKRHEDTRADLLNLVAARTEAPRKSIEKGAKLCSERAKQCDEKIDEYYDAHRKATEEYVGVSEPTMRQEKLEEIAKIERLIQGMLKMRAANQREFVRLNARSADMQAEQNVLLQRIDLPQQPTTSSGQRKVEKIRKRPKRAEEQAA